MNTLDQWVKHKIKARYYLRYADDFVIFSKDKDWLENLTPKIQEFLTTSLKLSLHSKKVFLQTLASGVDFLGWVHFTDHRVLRKTTKKRMLRKIEENPTDETLQSYLGLLRYGKGYKIRKILLDKFL